MKRNIILFLVLAVKLTTAQNFKPTDPVPGPTCEAQLYIEELILQKVNKYREKHGQKPLTLEQDLEEATMHHVQYMRTAKDMEHDETIDLPDFEELEWISHRYRRYVDKGKYWKITEELQSTLVRFNVDSSPKWVPDGMFSFEYVANHCVEGFRSSPSHWRALMSSDYHGVFIFYDLNYNDPNNYGAAVICTITLGMYSDPYLATINK